MSLDVFNRNPVKFSKGVLQSAKNVRQYSIAGFLILAQLFIYVSAPHVFNEMAQDMLLVYFMMVAFSFAVLDLSSPLWKIKLGDGLAQYMVFFVGGLFLFSHLGMGSGSENYGGFGSLSTLIIAQSFVVAMSEELMFRGGLPTVFQKSGMTKQSAILVSTVAFAGFHGWAYGWNPTLLLGSFLFGLLMAYFWYGGNLTAKDSSGYPLVACGLHAAWNVAILGGPFMIMGSI
jgi:membrane protease YdiL (CAAX protease family)